MRFSTVCSAYFLGLSLPAMELIRRKANFDHLAYYADDFIVGGFLLYAARAATKNKSRGMLLLAVAWALLCGGLYYSFFGQVYSSAAIDISGMPNIMVVAIKGCLLVFAIVNLIMAVKLSAKIND